MNKKEHQEWLDSLKVGDEIAYKWGYGEGAGYKIGKITNITPKRFIDSGNIRFNRNGEPPAGVHGVGNIVPVTAELKRDMTRRELILEIEDKIRHNKLSLETLTDVRNLIRWELDPSSKPKNIIFTELK